VPSLYNHCWRVARKGLLCVSENLSSSFTTRSNIVFLFLPCLMDRCLFFGCLESSSFCVVHYRRLGVCTWCPFVLYCTAEKYRHYSNTQYVFCTLYCTTPMKRILCSKVSPTRPPALDKEDVRTVNSKVPYPSE
jgi:hypothetical protein